MSMNDRERQAAIKFIQSLSEKDLVDLFYEAIKSRNEDKVFDDGYEKDRICVIQTHYGKFKNKEDKEHYSEFMALPTPELAGLDWVKNESEITQQGECPKCKAAIICATKEAICPICDSVVECT